MMETVPAAPPNRVLVWVRQLRCEQWVKNGFVVAPLVFGMKLGDAQAALRVGLAVVAFCLASSASYIVNDLLDVDDDSRHPEKRLRPLAAGHIGKRSAILVVCALLLASSSVGIAVSGLTLIHLGLYTLLTAVYSARLKQLAVVDVVALATGYVVRVLAGASAANVSASPWVLTATFFIALVLGFGKRRAELAALADTAAASRSVLASYDLRLLDSYIEISTASTIITYALYAVESETAARLSSGNFIITLPFVVFGLFRYLFILRKLNAGDNPTKMLITDVPLATTILAWGAIVLALLYLP